MFGIIQISQVVFSAHISSFRSAEKMLAGLDPTFPEYSGKSNVIELYQKQFDELAKLMTSYVTFLEKDLSLMSQTGKELFAVDQQLREKIEQKR
ncbi:hypothetical protein [Streptococcus marimammalium]|uniref:hypothetical protein n=1 Tax=Streptococcus marimammalium TaxID=269666 RepID=UPI00036A8974|nr:hypothetical protein [Streptococcus marimammalium]